MSQFGQKVVAVIDTQSAFGVTIRTLKANVDTLTGQLSTLLADAPETLDTLNEIAAAISDDPAFFTTMATANATLQANIDALTTAASTARAALQSALQSDINLRATIDTPTFTGHVFSPEFRASGSGHLKLRAPVGNDLNVYLADQETLQITRDPSTGNPKFTAKGGSGEFKFNQKVDLDGGLKIGGTDVTATAAEINAVDGRLDILEADAVTQAYVDAQVTNLVDAAPGALDTLNELAAALGDDADFATTITNSIAAVQADVNQNETDADTAIALKANIDSPTFTTKIKSPEFHSDGSHLKFKGDTNDIIFYPNNTETLQITRHSGTGHPNFTANGGSGEFKFNQITDLAGGVKLAGTAVTATAAEINAFDGRLDTLEADPTTATALAAVQADVDANEASADSSLATLSTNLNNEGAVRLLADNALDTRLDVLEADPTTATALAAVQADVNQNESDADTAIALKANAADARFTGLTGINTTSPDADHPCTILGEGKYGTNGVLAIEDSTSVEAGNGGGITFKGIRDVAGNQTVYGGIRSKKDNATAGQYGAHVELVTRANGSGDTEVGFTVKSDQSCETAGALLLGNGLTDAANDSAAATAGVAVNQLYRNGSIVMIRVS